MRDRGSVAPSSSLAFAAFIELAVVCVERRAAVLAIYSPTCRDGTICSVLALLARGERRANTEVKTATAHVCVESDYIRPLVPGTV